MTASAPSKKLMRQGATMLGGSAKPTTRGRGSSRGVRGRAKGSGLSSTVATPVGCKRVRARVQTPALVDLGPPAKRGRHGRASTDSGRVLGSLRSHSLPTRYTGTNHSMRRWQLCLGWRAAIVNREFLGYGTCSYSCESSGVLLSTSFLGLPSLTATSCSVAIAPTFTICTSCTI